MDVFVTPVQLHGSIPHSISYLAKMWNEKNTENTEITKILTFHTDHSKKKEENKQLLHETGFVRNMNN